MRSDDQTELERRYAQAMTDADIEGLPRLPALEARIAEWDAEGLGDEDRLLRLHDFFETMKTS